MITSYWIVDGIIVVTITIVTAMYLYMTRKFKYWKKRGVFEITPTPFFGNFAQCVFSKKNPNFILQDLYQQAKGKPYIGFHILDKPCLLIRDPEVMKNIMIKDFNYFCNRMSTSDPKDRLGSASLAFIKNPAWKILKSKLTPIFTSGKLKKMFVLLLRTANNLDEYFDSLGLQGKGQMLDMKDIFSKLAMDMICNTTYGIEMDSLNDSNSTFQKKGKTIFDTNNRGYEMLAVFFYPEIAKLAGISFFGKKASTFLRDIFWNAINCRIESGQTRGDLIDILIDFRKNYGDKNLGGFKFDGDDLVAQAAIFFAGGFETTSSTMTFTMYELALHPDIQDKLRREIIHALDKSDGQITYDMVMELSYLDMVVSEAMRKYPTVPSIDREALEDYKLPNSDLIIEKNTPIFISLLSLHCDPQYFAEPDKFDPERFNEENKRNIPACAYMPFGEGPRMCIGSRLGLLQIKVGIIKMLCRYEVSPCEKTLIPMVLDPRAALTAPLNYELYVNVRRINTNV